MHSQATFWVSWDCLIFSEIGGGNREIAGSRITDSSYSWVGFFGSGQQSQMSCPKLYLSTVGIDRFIPNSTIDIM